MTKRALKGRFYEAASRRGNRGWWQIVCFLLLTHLEPNFFLIHLDQSILYIAILVMLFYMEDRWAYMIGMLASIVWLGLAYESGILGSGVGQLSELRTAG